MTEYGAEVVPDQTWTEDGTADVTPLQPFDGGITRELPLEHRVVEADIVVKRSEYPSGVVLIPQGSGVTGESAVFPMLASSGDEIVYEYPGFQSLPDGIVFWFID